MKLSSILILPILIIVSCTGNENEEHTQQTNETSDSLDVDSSLVDTLIIIEQSDLREEIDVSKLLVKSNQSFELPLLIDSTFIEKYALQGEEAEYNLTYPEAKYLGFEFPDGDLVSGGSWRINTFINIDSMKSVGAYEDYLESLDLGQARYCIGQVIGNITINPQSQMLIWNLDYATYEACPYGYGTYVFGTIFTNGVGTNTCLLAEDSGGGDPPSWGEGYMQSEITDTTITVLNIDTWGEYGDDGEDDFVEKQERTEILSFDSYGFTVVKKGGGYEY